MGDRSALVFLFLLGCSRASTPGLPEPGSTVESPGSFRAELLLGETEEALEHGLSATHFNFAYLRDLWFRAKVPSMPTTSIAEVRFLTPQGNLFYSDSFAFSPDPLVTTMPTGGSHDRTVYHAKEQPGGFALDHMVPVAGSIFHRYPNPGMWQVEVHVEGYPEALTSQLEIELTR
jgi:hypothetical protein